VSWLRMDAAIEATVAAGVQAAQSYQPVTTTKIATKAVQQHHGRTSAPDDEVLQH
jgi:hypothetical protein